MVKMKPCSHLQPFVDTVRSACINRCRIRRTICHTVMDWDNLQMEVSYPFVYLNCRVLMGTGGGSRSSASRPQLGASVANARRRTDIFIPSQQLGLPPETDPAAAHPPNGIRTFNIRTGRTSWHVLVSVTHLLHPPGPFGPNSDVHSGSQKARSDGKWYSRDQCHSEVRSFP